MKDIRLWGILVVALAIRALMLQSAFTDVRRAVTPDSKDYLNLRFHMLSNAEFSQHLRPEVFRTPGYPGFLAATEWVAQETIAYKPPQAGVFADPDQEYPWPGLAGLFSDRNCDQVFLRAALSFQVLLDLHLVLLTFFLGRALASHGVGLLAALGQAVSPLAAAASCRILTDGIFAFMLTASLLLLIRHFRTGGWWSLISAAGIMGVACYVRPVGLAFSAVMALVLVCRAKRIRRTAAFAGIVLACIAPWVARNIIVADYWGFSSFATDSMYWYSAAEIEARKQRKSAESIREEFSKTEMGGESLKVVVGAGGNLTAVRTPDPNAPINLTPGGLARYRWAKARKIILAHPGEFLAIHLKGDVAFWLPGAPDALEVLGYTSGGKGTLDVLHREGIIPAGRHYFGDNTTAMILAGVMMLVTLIRYVGILLAGLWRLRPRMSAAGWLCVLLVTTAWLLPGPANHPRFRVPVAPILSVAAAIGYIGLVEWRRKRKAGNAPANQET